jgi:hypothetical protein
MIRAISSAFRSACGHSAGSPPQVRPPSLRGLGLAGGRPGVAGISGDGDPAELSADAQLLDDAIADGNVLPVWAPLARQH